MPIYEYECPSHGRFEVSQRITENALSTCTTPDCGQPIRKLISHTSFALKGSGWYATDYKSAPAPAAAPAAKGDAATPAKTDAKPAESAPKAESAPAAPATGTSSAA